jgi:hypothetical protein
MTQEDIARRIIEQDGCYDVSCLGTCDWNQGVECPLLKEGKCTAREGIVLKAKAWLNEHGLPPYSSTFTIAHRFKPGDRVRHKHDTAGPVTTVDEVVFTADCGAFYRFAEAGTPSGSISYCDKNLLLADREDEAEKAKEMP